MTFCVEYVLRGITLADDEQLYFDEELNAALCTSSWCRGGKA